MKRLNVIGAVWLLSLVLVASCQQSGEQTVPAKESMSSAERQRRGVVTELLIEDIVLGEGAEAVAGASVTVHYTGWLYASENQNNRGKKFDSSLDRGQPFEFLIGAGRVIRGWDEGVEGMRVGGQRVLIIPADLGYGARGAGDVIPPNATLVFAVELLGVD